MNRRSFLATVGIAATSGCTFTTDNTGQTTTSRTGASATTSTTNKPQASVEISRSSVILGDSVTAPQDDQIPWGVVDVENTTSNPHAGLEIELRYYSTEGNILEVRNGLTHLVPAATTWRLYSRYYTETPDQVERVDTRIAGQEPVVAARQLDTASVVSTTLDASAEGGVDFAAEVDLGGASPERVTVLGLLFDSTGRFRGTVRGVESNPATTVAISGSRLIRTPPNLGSEQVTDAKVLVFAGNP